MPLTDFCDYPVIQAPMAGGITTPQLVAAVSNAGAIGALAAPLLSPATMAEQIDAIRALTKRPFIVNLFVLQTPQPAAQDIARAQELLRPVWEQFGWSELPLPAKWCEDFNAQLDALVAARPAIASFTFGILTDAQCARLHAAGIFVVGTATNVAEALAWERVGADAVCAQGIEAGGHRGTFIGAQNEGLATLELVRQTAAAVRIPVIAAGGIMDGRGIAEALAAGAQAVQMGTAFLVTDESGASPLYKARLLEAGRAPARAVTRLTRAFSGRYARGLANRFMDMMQEAERQVPDYPVQNALTGPIRAQAAKQSEPELMSLWAGQGVAKARAMPAAHLVQALVAEWRSASIEGSING